MFNGRVGGPGRVVYDGRVVKSPIVLFYLGKGRLVCLSKSTLQVSSY